MKNALSIVHGGNTACQQIVNGSDMVSIVKKAFVSGVEVAIAFRVPKGRTKAEALPCLRDLMSIGLNQKTASLLCGVSQPYASKLLRGKMIRARR